MEDKYLHRGHWEQRGHHVYERNKGNIGHKGHARNNVLGVNPPLWRENSVYCSRTNGPACHQTACTRLQWTAYCPLYSRLDSKPLYSLQCTIECSALYSGQQTVNCRVGIILYNTVQFTVNDRVLCTVQWTVNFTLYSEHQTP